MSDDFPSFIVELGYNNFIKHLIQTTDKNITDSRVAPPPIEWPIEQAGSRDPEIDASIECVASALSSCCCFSPRTTGSEEKVSTSTSRHSGDSKSHLRQSIGGCSGPSLISKAKSFKIA